MNLMNSTRLLVALALATLGISLPAAATVTYSWSAGSSCGDAPVASFNPGGAAFQASLCASTTAPTEGGCGFSAILVAATPAESNAFSVTARTLGSNYPDATSAPALPFLITNPAPLTPVAVDFGGTIALGGASIGPALNQLLATFTFQPQATATNTAYVIGMNAASEFSTASGGSCMNAANSGAALPRLTLNLNTATTPVITSANSATFTVATAGTFNVTTTGQPVAAITANGTLPGGVTLTAAGILAGTPASGSAGTYPLTITAANGAPVNGTQSFTLTVVKRAQTITFNAINAQPLAASTLTVTASASSALAVAFASTTPNTCTVNGSTVSFVAAGACTITASQLGNIDFNAAAAISQSFNITATVPSAPIIGTATPGNALAIVTFTVPTANGGSAITGYTAACSGGSASTVPVVTATSTGSPITVTGLSNGVTYACSVRATNSVGTGQPSASVGVTPLEVAIALFSNTNVAVYGAPVTLRASVTGITVTGSVTFSIFANTGQVTLPGCNAVPLVGGTASCIAPGSYQTQNPRQYLATYSGDANNAQASANLLQAVGTNAAVLTVAASPLPPIVAGRTTTLTALVKMNSPAGTVTFFDNGVPVAGCAQLALTLLPDAIDSAVANCTVTAPASTTGIKQYVVSYFYPAGHVSGRVFEQTTFDLRVVAQGPQDYTDMWWAGTSENGWGMSVTQHGPIQFNVIFAYDAQGKSVWYVMPGGSFNAAGNVFTGPLFLATSSPFSAYDKSKFAIGAPVGSAVITYTSASTATLAYTINGINATKSIQRQIFSLETPGANLRTNDLWWATADEDGWGMNIAQQGRVLFPIWYTYDAVGKPIFFTAQGGSWNGTVWSGQLFAHESSPWLGVPYNPAAFKAVNVGTISLDFNDASNATMTTTVNGITQVRHIERQPY